MTIQEIREREIAVKRQFNEERRQWLAEFNARQRASEKAFRDEKQAFLDDVTTRERAAIAEATKGRCVATVWGSGWNNSHRCERLAGFGRNGDYCKQHAKQYPDYSKEGTANG